MLRKMWNWLRGKPTCRVIDVTEEPELETVDDYVTRHSGLKSLNRPKSPIKIKRKKKAKVKILTPAQKKALRRVRKPSKPGRRGK